jgi:phenylacetate-CoA ligase
MPIYQQFFKHILNPIDLWRTGDYAEIRYWKEFERTQYLSADALNELIWKRLRHILDTAYRKIPYYKSAFDRAGIVPSDIKTDTDMLAVPILEKRDVQTNLPTMLDSDYPKNLLIFDKTGGSTGTPVNYYYSRYRKWTRQAAALRHDRWAGYDTGQRQAAIWGAARDITPSGLKQKIKSFFFPEQLILNSINMTPALMLEFNEKLKRYKPTTLLAYANALALFASFLKQQGVSVYQPKGIITSAEVLHPEDRTLIEELFHAKVFNRLGCREFSVIASECECHTGMHIMAEGLYIEIVRGNRHTEAGELGEILVTDLFNEPMPMIRYRLGDTASRVAGTCPCGRSLPQIDQVAGRVTDFLVGVDGQFCSGVAMATFIVSKKPSFGQIQIIQDERNKILYRVGCGKKKQLNSKDIEFLREQTELYLGKGIEIECEFVDSIPHEASGKFLFSKSKVAREIMGKPPS